MLLHNLEEAVWLPAWSRRHAGRWHLPEDAGSFRFAVAVLTLGVVLIAAWAQHTGPGSWGHYLLASYALGQGLNVFVPHLLATLAARRYAPVLVTGVLFVLPSAAWLVVKGFSTGHLAAGRFLVTAAVFIPGVLLSIPVLLRIGKRILG